MIQKQLKGLNLGVYRIYWEGPDGGSSVATIGMDHMGQYWFAPSNWITVPGLTWGDVERIELIDVQHHDKFDEASKACAIVNAYGKMEPCGECGKDYPRADLLRGEVFCLECRIDKEISEKARQEFASVQEAKDFIVWWVVADSPPPEQAKRYYAAKEYIKHAQRCAKMGVNPL